MKRADLVRAARVEYALGGVTQDALAKRLGVHVETLRCVLKRKTLANVL